MAGQSDEDALAAGKQAGLTRLEPVVVERLNIAVCYGVNS
jgi:hypothetical protein